MYAALEAWELDAPDFSAGNCARQAPAWDYDIDGEEPEDRNTRFDYALAQCRLCPLMAKCRAWSIEEGLSGVWGGRIVPTSEAGNMLMKCEQCRTPVHGKRRDAAANRGKTALCRACALN